MKKLIDAFHHTAPLSEPSAGTPQYSLTLADEKDRQAIYRIRHDVYACELGQHPSNHEGSLSEPLDAWNVYLVVKVGNSIAGFVSITPPGSPSYSIDKYFMRSELPFPVDGKLFEVRLLTVLKAYRGREIATLLMYAAFRWVEAHAGNRIVAIGRREVLDLYVRTGLVPTGQSIQSGAVTYELLHASTERLRAGLQQVSSVLSRLAEKTAWKLNIQFQKPTSCFHGGAFFSAIGETFDKLERHHSVISADVLDAWFPPAPQVVAAVQKHLSWLVQTSPPAACEGLVRTIAEVRGVAVENILPGAGSSDLIFRALRQWLTPASHALILDPTYGEYAHVLEQVIGCTVDRLPLARAENFDVNLSRLRSALTDDYDLVVLVNPNSPTGRHIPRAILEEILGSVRSHTRLWVDETYVEYAGPEQSLERFAAKSENVIVCKSMSKVYALSGARVAYLCAGPHQLEALHAITPPWVVSLPAQVAAVEALRQPEYYQARYAETVLLREHIANELRKLGWGVVPGIANFVLCHLPPDSWTAAAMVQACRQHNVFLRDASVMGSTLGKSSLRIAVKDSATNARMLEVIRQVWQERPHLA